MLTRAAASGGAADSALRQCRSPSHLLNAVCRLVPSMLGMLPSLRRWCFTHKTIQSCSMRYFVSGLVWFALIACICERVFWHLVALCVCTSNTQRTSTWRNPVWKVNSILYDLKTSAVKEVEEMKKLPIQLFF